MTDAPQPRLSTSIAIYYGAGLIGLGIVLNLISGMFDGFPKGLFLGAGVMLILIGAFMLSGPLRRQVRGGEPAHRDDTR